LRRHRLRVVERADADAAQAGQRLGCPGHLHAAGRAELHADPAARLVGAVLVRLQLAPDPDLLLLEIGAEAERAAGAPLAPGAASDRVARRLAFDLVADRAADAAAFPHPCHTPYPFSRSAIASSTSISLAAS